MEKELSTQVTVAVIITPVRTHHFVSQKTCDLIYSSKNEDMVQLDDGTWMKVGLSNLIIPIDEYYKQFPEKSSFKYGQTYSPIPDTPPVTYEDIIASAKKTNHIEALAKGIKKAIEKRKKIGLESQSAEKLLAKVRDQFRLVKSGSVKTKYEPKYKKYQEAEAAGVF